METKTMAISTIMSILSKTVKNQDDPPAVIVAKDWLEILAPVDGTTSITFETSDIENRLCYLLDNQKDHILEQLPVGENIENNIVQEEVSVGPVQSESVTLVEEDELPTPQPAVVLASKTKAIDPVSPPTAVAAPPAHIGTHKFTTFFVETQKVAPSFNDMLCNALETAFTNINNNQLNQFNMMVSRFAEIEANMAAFETRINSKLAEIYNTTCISANNTESMSGMFNTHSTKTKHVPEFSE